MVDGDTCLVVADKDLIKIAKRNMNDIVPLYYNMKKAEPTQLNNKTIYEGLNKAFISGNIGLYSNDISKIWNHEAFINGTANDKQEAIDVVKLLCMENNFCIDSAKTLYMPKRPQWFKPIVSKYTNCQLPAFFQYAKDKEISQVKERNNSFVNKIFDKIPNKPINTRSLKLGTINYKNMMRNPNIICSKEVSDKYDKLNKQYRYMINMKDEHIDNLRYVACKIRNEFNTLGYCNETITDMLIEYLYSRNKRYKQLLWFCYGQYIVNNLEKNIKPQKTKFIQCIDCGEWIEIPIQSKSERCEKCQKEYRKKWDRERKKKNSTYVKI